ncbi:MAG TPA: hypothetical protein VGI87_13290, partial [Solirubrobacteraceae bacterium]
YRVSTAHFDPDWRGLIGRARPLDQILVEHSTFHRGHLKERLYDEGVKERVCEMCGQGERWQGRAMALILDHVNGVPDDNRLENLRIVCPNCAATLETHCGRKNRIEIVEHACLHCGGAYRPKYPSQRYCSRSCGRRDRGSTAPRPEARKVVRPSYDQLVAELEASSFLAVGRKYGVSDNAVRKWLRAYQSAERR